MSGQPVPPRARKHLMVPGQPRPVYREPMSLSRVQRWVMSTLIATTILHLAAGIIVAAAFSARMDAKVGLVVIGGAFGVLAVLSVLLIHKQRPVSPWLLLGVLPSVVGAFWVF